MKSVNDSLNDLDFEFRLSHDEISGKKMYGLVRASSTKSKGAT